MIYLNKKIVLYVLFLLLAVIHFVTTSVARDNIFTAIENLPRPVKQAKSGSLPTKSSSTRKRKRLRTSGRLLGRPNPIKCSRRPKQLVDNNSGHYYFLSEDSIFKVNTFCKSSISCQFGIYKCNKCIPYSQNKFELIIAFVCTWHTLTFISRNKRFTNHAQFSSFFFRIILK